MSTDNPVTDNQNDLQVPELDGKTFQEKVNLLTEHAYRLLAKHVPELDGIAFIFVWDPALRGTQGLDFGRIWGRNTESPRFRLHSLEQTQRLLTWQSMQLHQQLVQADAIAQQLDKDLHAKRQELEQLGQAIQDLRASGVDAPDSASTD